MQIYLWQGHSDDGKFSLIMEIMEGNIVHQMKVNVRRQDSTEHMEVSLGKDCVNNKQRPAYVTMPVRLLFFTSNQHIF